MILFVWKIMSKLMKNRVKQLSLMEIKFNKYWYDGYGWLEELQLKSYDVIYYKIVWLRILFKAPPKSAQLKFRFKRYCILLKATLLEYWETQSLGVISRVAEPCVTPLADLFTELTQVWPPVKPLVTPSINPLVVTSGH